MWLNYILNYIYRENSQAIAAIEMVIYDVAMPQSLIPASNQIPKNWASCYAIFYVACA